MPRGKQKQQRVQKALEEEEAAVKVKGEGEEERPLQPLQQSFLVDEMEVFFPLLQSSSNSAVCAARHLAIWVSQGTLEKPKASGVRFAALR